MAAYCRRMAQGGVWGGGIEMAAVSHLKRVNVFVYQARAHHLHPTRPLQCDPEALRPQTSSTRALSQPATSQPTTAPWQGDVSRGFRRISSFEVPHATKAVRVLYGSGVHYDALDARL